MFGHDWEPARATIVASHVKKTSGDGMVSIREFAADVVTSSGVRFRALIQEPRIATNFWAPSVGDVIDVLADAKRQKAKFDKADPAISAKAHQRAADAQFRETLTQPAAGAVPVDERAAAALASISEIKRMRDVGEITHEEYEARSRAIIRDLQGTSQHATSRPCNGLQMTGANRGTVAANRDRRYGSVTVSVSARRGGYCGCVAASGRLGVSSAVA